MGQLCLKRHKPLFVLDVDPSVAAGNQRLIRAGASPLDTNHLDACLDGDSDGPMTLF